jgi:hypothetical protein
MGGLSSECYHQPVSHELRGRGVTAGEAEKVGVGAAAGAVVGRVITDKTKGAVVGGVAGAATGKGPGGHAWENVKDAVKDAWHRVTGKHDLNADKMSESEVDRLTHGGRPR